jgi:hypothetical protein
MRRAHACDLRLEAGCVEIGDLRAGEILPSVRLAFVVVEHDHRFDVDIAGCPQRHRFAGSRCGGKSRCRRIGRRRPEQSAGADVRASGSDRIDELRGRIGDDELEGQSVLRREHLQEVGVESRRLAVDADEVRRRPGPHQHDQCVRGCRRRERFRRRADAFDDGERETERDDEAKACGEPLHVSELIPRLRQCFDAQRL